MDDLIRKQQMMREYQSLCSHLSCAECSMFKPYDHKCLLEEWIEKFPTVAKNEVVGDAISRKQAIDAIWDRCDTEKHGRTAKTQEIVWSIENLPSIEPRKGRWIYSDGTPAELWGSYRVYCTACKEQSEYASNFCGMCGADMRGDKK